MSAHESTLPHRTLSMLLDSAEHVDGHQGPCPAGANAEAPDAVALLYRFRWIPLAALVLVSIAPNLGWALH